MIETTGINNYQYTGWFKLHILLHFIYENIVLWHFAKEKVMSPLWYLPEKTYNRLNHDEVGNPAVQTMNPSLTQLVMCSQIPSVYNIMNGFQCYINKWTFRKIQNVIECYSIMSQNVIKSLLYRKTANISLCLEMLKRI